MRRNEAPLADALAFAALWVGQEAFRGWFLTGFPWLYSGYSQLDGPLAGLAPVGGMWLISLSLALSAALLVNLPRLVGDKPRLAAALLLLLAPWGIGLALQGNAWTTSKGEPLKVAAVQGNVEQNMKWDPTQLEAQLNLYRDMTLSSRPADLIVWPETAVPVLKEYAEGYLKVMGRVAAERDAALITGVPLRQSNEHGEKRYYNAITVTGWGEGTYLKQKLVPFGEYVPLQEVLRGLIAFFDLPMSDFARGPADQALLQAKQCLCAAGVDPAGHVGDLQAFLVIVVMHQTQVVQADLFAHCRLAAAFSKGAELLAEPLMVGPFQVHALLTDLAHAVEIQGLLTVAAGLVCVAAARVIPAYRYVVSW
mgnify:CR=1 FL=1